MSNLRTWAKWSVVAVVLLLSPVFAFLTAIAVEALLDLVLEVGVPAILDVMAIGAILWLLFHKHGPQPDGAQSGSEKSDAWAVTAPPEWRLGH
jgi:predicted signal transduction protein with EAL and GGDEF domain